MSSLRSGARATASAAALASILVSVLTGGPAEAHRVTDADTGAPSSACTPVLARAMPMSRAITVTGASTLARVNDSTSTALRRDVASGAARHDDSLWADRCGKAFYLDFDGETVTGTGWNQSVGQATFTVDPFSMTAPADTDFSTDELTAIQVAWQEVAEDFAVWGIDVTTEKPSDAALFRDTLDDRRFGQTFVMTDTAPMRDTCGCAGVAYVDTWGVTGSSGRYHHYAWGYTAVLAPGTSVDGTASLIGSVASHEIGHTLSLGHDGVGTSAYSNGFNQWAPIMGVAQGRPVGQWSDGSYAGSTNTEDDLARISARAPLLADDVPDDAGSAVALAPGIARTARITTTTDVDAFAFTGAPSGPTTITVEPTAALTNLDVSVRILDGAGQTVTLVNPVSTRVSQVVAGGMGASWSGAVPAGETYTAIVDGGGTGDGSGTTYTDYGSLGGYAVTLVEGGVAPTPAPTPSPTPTPTPTPVPDADPPTFVTPRLGLPSGVVGRRYSAPVEVLGEAGPYSWSGFGTPPPGLDLTRLSSTLVVRLAGRPRRAGTFVFALRVTDATGRSTQRRFVVRIRRA